MAKPPPILIIEMGSQHTLQIQRCLRELGHQSLVLSPKDAARWLVYNPIKCAIGSGGMKSVYEDGAPKVPPIVLHDYGAETTPYLGICFGMQDLVRHYGGQVTRGQPEYARTEIYADISDLSSGAAYPLMAGLESRQQVWMSHADSVAELPPALIPISWSIKTGHIAGVAHVNGKHFGVQFHPEVSHTKNGKVMLKNFVELVAGCTPSFETRSLIDTLRTQLAGEVGERKAVIGFSGGVDSTTLAALASLVLGDRLLAIVIDAGHLREGEIAEIQRNAKYAGVTLKVIDASEHMIASIGKTIDAEEKRHAFRKEYAALFRQAALEFGAEVILQGTIAPDRIESGTTGGAKIKTHHNSDGLDFGNLEQSHPLGSLYKDEVRALGRDLGLPKAVFNRQPFPGPGLFLRIIGMPVDAHKLQVLQWADARVREALLQSRTYRDLSQVVVALLPKAVGVKGDGRVYEYMVAVRAVRTLDFMTAEGVEFSAPMQRKLKTLLGEHPNIVHVGFFPMDKPPATTEFE